jgi:hypothetical protein
MPKDKLSDRLSKRFITEQKVEVQDPLAAATTSLDKDANIQTSTPESTQDSTDASMPVREQESMQDGKNARMHAYTPDVIHESMNVSTNEDKPEGKQTRKKTSTPARTQESKSESTPASNEVFMSKGVDTDMLYDQIQQKKHLSNGSFRYRADELEKLEIIYRDLDSQKPGRISKNDIARMALIAFYEDYEKNGEESILARVFKRM